jgi:clan AA aspartic protease (TIGR02281 family)
MSWRWTTLLRETRPPSEPPSKLWWIVAGLAVVIVLPDFGWRHTAVEWLKSAILAFDDGASTAPPIKAPPHERAAPEAPQLTVALNADNRCIIELTLNGIGPFRFLVDTGAPDTTLPAAMGRRIGVDLNRVPPDHNSGGWGGGRTNGVFVRLNEIRLKNFRLQHFEVAVENETSFAEGLAGVTFINQLRRFELSGGTCRFWW